MSGSVRLRNELVIQDGPLTLMRDRGGGPVADVWILEDRALLTQLRQHDDVLDDGERRRADLLRHAEQQATFVASHVALRLLLARYLGRDPSTLALIRDARGRPRLLGSPASFSLTRVTRGTAIAIARCDVGIDLDTVSSHELMADVLAWLHPSDRFEVLRQPAPLRPLALAACWTRLEALLKATGRGLDGAAARLPVGASPVPRVVSGHHLESVRTETGYVASVALSLAVSRGFDHNPATATASRVLHYKAAQQGPDD